MMAWPRPRMQRDGAAAYAFLLLCTALGSACAPLAPASTDGSAPGRAAPRLTRAEPIMAGMDPSLPGRVDSIVGHALVEGAAPGAAVAIGRYGRLVRLQGYGALDRRPGFSAVTDSTIYDIASMTKVVGTTTAVMMLVDDGVLSLDDPVARHLTEWRGTAREHITVRNLLVHDSGLPSYGPLYRELRGREQYLRRIAAMSMEYATGSRTLYSDYGVILLALIVERASGQALDEFLERRLFGPLGMRDTGFNPLSRTGAAPDRIAPTEVDTVFRHRHIRGEVHDENAYALGGVAGHAGLFSSARDLAVFAQMMLNGGEYAGRRYIQASTIASFTRRQAESSSRALGWDTPGGTTSAGSYFSASSFGHTGFTGTSIWLDPERQLFVILLTNRVNPTRDNQRHIALRRDLADAVQQSIVDVPVMQR
jgi:CubicO group peptidase (beta-lactamase class C family)